MHIFNLYCLGFVSKNHMNLGFFIYLFLYSYIFFYINKKYFHFMCET